MKLGKGIENAQGETKTEAKSMVLSQTVATEFEDERLQIEYEDCASMSGISQTSYAQSLHGGGTITVPPPPLESANGRPFECPYCYFVITSKNRAAWTRHVFKDLSPYVCVFPSCVTPNKMYDSRHGWFEHELKYHLNDSISPDTTAADCPLCTTSILFARLDRHLARHLEELALFALPRHAGEEDEISHVSKEWSPEAAIVDVELSNDSDSNIEQNPVRHDIDSDSPKMLDSHGFPLETGELQNQILP